MNRLKFLLVLIWLFPFAQTVYASSNSKLDSLERAYRSATDDSSKTWILADLFVAAKSTEQAISYLERADEYLKNGRCPCCEVTHLSNWGSFYNSKGEYQKSEAEFLKAIALFKRSSCTENRITPVYLNIGQNYQEMGEMEKAVEFMSLGLDEAMQAGETRFQLTALNNLGIVYFGLGQYDKAADYYTRALAMAKEAGRPKMIPSIQLNLGNVHYMDHDFEAALEAFSGALEIGEATQDSARLPTRYISVGLAYYGMEKPDLAAKNMNKGLLIARKIGNRPMEATALRNLSSVAAYKENYPQAIQYILQSLQIYEDLEQGPAMSRAYPTLAGYYNKVARHQLAYETQVKYSNLKDSLLQRRMDSQLAEQLAAFETARLQVQNDSIQAALTISEQAGKIKDLEISRYTYAIIGLAGFLVLVLITIVLFTRSQKLKEKLRMAELKHTALRARMNPHFLFNALNAIQNAILNRDKMVAYEYHAKFSDLMRMVLMHSEQKTIKLRDEIEALELYLELEQFRTSHGFAYTIQLGPEIDPETQEIPSMLLQPFVENAIFHGVLNRETPGAITLRIQKKTGFLQCAIEDDGVGRAEAMRLRNLNNPGHESFATKMTGDRIDLFRQQYGNHVQLRITDKITHGQPTGTLVELSIPMTTAS